PSRPARNPVGGSALGGIGGVLRGLFLGAPQDEILAMDQPQDAFYRLHKGAAGRTAWAWPSSTSTRSASGSAVTWPSITSACRSRRASSSPFWDRRAAARPR